MVAKNAVIVKVLIDLPRFRFHKFSKKAYAKSLECGAHYTGASNVNRQVLTLCIVYYSRAFEQRYFNLLVYHMQDASLIHDCCALEGS